MTDKVMNIGGTLVGKGRPPFVLAEMACAHDGKVDLAIKMVNDAADAGADGIQFQLFTTARLLTPRHKFYQKVRSLEITYSAWENIFGTARRRGLRIFANPLTIDALEAVKSYGADAIKIHSADLANPDMIRLLSHLALPICVSAGGSTEKEIGDALNSFRSEGISDLILLHGYQAYPTAVENSNLNYIKTLEDRFGVLVGYQDHVDGSSEMATILPIVASALGAVLIEKHITDSTERKGTDFESAVDKRGFRTFVDMLKLAYSSLGAREKKHLTPDELEYRRTFKKSIVAAKDIKDGEMFSREMLAFMRADDFDLSPDEIDKVIDKKCKRFIKAFEIIKREDID